MELAIPLIALGGMYIVSNQKIELLGMKASVSLSDGIKELVKGLPMFERFPYTNL